MVTETTFTLDVNVSILQAYHIDIRTALFFDIETTGFTAKTSQLYMIGAAYYKECDNCFHLIQWLDETGHQAAHILSEFMTLAQSYSTLIHFNGDGFDIPYLKAVCQQCQMDYTLHHLTSFDLYKQIRSYGRLLCLSHLKQKNIEEFLGINRKDTMNGGQLINIYKEYQKKPEAAKEALLFLHNADDIQGMLSILPVLAYPLLSDNQYNVQRITTDSQTAYLHLALDYPLPRRVSCGKGNLLLTAHKQTAQLHIPVYTGELKFFYPNYKDYYYLPVEDTAIHKSVAFYVDREYRTQAKAATCYSKKSGLFLPQPEPVISPYFKLEYTDKITYFELSEDRISDYDTMQSYVNCLMQYLLD